MPGPMKVWNSPPPTSDQTLLIFKMWSLHILCESKTEDKVRMVTKYYPKSCVMTHYVLPSAGLSNKWPEAGKGQTKFGLLQQNLFYHTTTEKLIGDLDMQYLGDKGVPGSERMTRTGHPKWSWEWMLETIGKMWKNRHKYATFK